MSLLPVSLRSHWKSGLDVVTSLVMIATAGALLWWNLPNRRVSAREPDLPSAPVSIANAAVKGSPEAAAVMIVFSDFECPYCGAFARDTMPQLEREYVTPGRLQIAYRYLPLPKHPHAPAAARAAECAGEQGQFWPMHDQLFGNGAKLDDQVLHAAARSLTLDDARYGDCLNGEASKAAVTRDSEQAKALGLESTPAFLLGLRANDGRVQVSKAFYGALPIEQFRTEIERAMNPESSWFKRVFSWSL